MSGPLRIGQHYRIHVYRCSREDGQPTDDDQPVATFQREEDAQLYLAAIDGGDTERPLPLWWNDPSGFVHQYAGALAPYRAVAMFHDPADASSAVAAVNRDRSWFTAPPDRGA